MLFILEEVSRHFDIIVGKGIRDTLNNQEKEKVCINPFIVFI
jgi:hypothetical protein